MSRKHEIAAEMRRIGYLRDFGTSPPPPQMLKLYRLLLLADELTTLVLLDD